MDVAPRAGAWIETLIGVILNIKRKSRPARARGLKQQPDGVNSYCLRVAPRAGAWIETKVPNPHKSYISVAPRAGAWIETALP